jgi:uncharacterized membrane protein (UPF0127 family)
MAVQQQTYCWRQFRYGRRHVKSFLDPILRADATALALSNGRNGLIVARTLLTAFDSASRRRGLLHRDVFADGSALIIAPCSAVHTFFMRFAIDVAFVSRGGRVLKLRPDMRPWRIAAAWRAFAVIELPVGALKRADIRTGDVLGVARI